MMYSNETDDRHNPTQIKRRTNFPCLSNAQITLKNEENDDRSPQIATSLALHLVSQVLDEACIIVNAAKNLSYPYQGITNENIINNDKFDNSFKENLTFTVEMGDNDDITLRNSSNSITTSTPQKPAETVKRSLKPDAYIIGQGDEDIYSEQNEFQEQGGLNRSTSTYINRLFDMSEVEFVLDDAKIIQKENSNFPLYEEVFNILESCIESAIDDSSHEIEKEFDEGVEKSLISEQSSYSLLGDAFTNDCVKNIAFYIDDDEATYSRTEADTRKLSPNSVKKHNLSDQRLMHPQDIAAYENAFITLNRDYEQYSEEEENEQQDLVPLALHDVELTAANTSEMTLPTNNKMDYRDLASTSVVSHSAGTRKSGLARRCRLQGARLLSCLRGWWWRRKLPGKRKEPRMPGAVRGQCPLTPSARQRAASLLDPRLMRSPSPLRRHVWKFNTINETMVNSAQWNDYSFEMKPDCDG